jgi:cholesterol transport system auxiliary component
VIVQSTASAGIGPRVASVAAALLLAFGLTACTSLVAGRPSAIFDLNAPGEPATPRGRAQVLVPEPTAVRALDTDRIAARPTASEFAYLPGAVWADRLPKLLQTRLVQTLQNSGRARAVAIPGQGMLIDYQILLDVRAFEYTGEGAVADFTVRVMDDHTGRVVRSRSFRYVVPVASGGNGGIVQALDQAMGQAFAEIANWALG